MTDRPSPFAARVRGLFGPDPSDARQSLAALGIGLVASLVAGLTLGAISDTLEALPGLLILVPAAIALRGTIFGALGARLSTSIHTGTFSLRLRTDTTVGQNLLAAAVLTVAGSVIVALLAKVVAAVFDFDTISIADLIVISTVGGVVASIVVAVVTVGLAGAAVRYGWDADNVMSPLVTACADVLTLPALWLATVLAGRGSLTTAIAGIAVLAAVGALFAALRSELMVSKRIVLESMPVLVAAALLSLIGGLVLEGRLDDFLEQPALLVLVPIVLAAAGAVGGILASRLTSKLHLGVVAPSPFPSAPARRDIALSFGVAVPTFLVGAVLAALAAVVVNLAYPGLADMVAIGLMGGLLATIFSAVVAYYSAVTSFRLGLDPDNFGVPLVTATIDLFGSISLIAAITLLVGT